MESIAIINSNGAVTQTGTVDCVPWWSFTKIVLSVAMLRLKDQGVLELDDKLPDEPYTARQLLRHEAGLPDYGTLTSYHADVAAGKPPWPIDKMLAAVDARRLRYRPGAAWAYSNIGYLKIAQHIEHCSGTGLATSLKELVFDPAGLQTARLTKERQDLAAVQMGTAISYHPSWVYHGLVVGTTTDAARLLWLLTNGHLLNPATFAEMMERRHLPEYKSAIQPYPAYGLGLMLASENPLSHPMGHGGEGPGSQIAVYTQNRRAAAVWTTQAAGCDATSRAYAILTAVS